MQYKAPKRTNLPNLFANPFDIMALNGKDLELLVGRDELFEALANNIRLISPRVVAIVGEKGSGRTSLIQSVAATTESVHTVFWPEKDEVTTILHQMYCDLMKDFETPPVHSVLISRLEKELSGNSGYLPLIIFDHKFLPGPELAEVLTKLMPVLTRIRALTLISLTPGQKAGFSEELLSEMDVTPPLELLSREEMASLINKRVRKASNSSWTAPPTLVDKVMDVSNGHVGRAMRFLRDFIDYSRGMPLADGRKIDMKVKISPNPTTEVEDPTFQRVAEMAPATSEVEVEILDTTEEPEPVEEPSASETDESEDEWAPRFPSLSEAAELWSGNDSDEELEEDEGEPQFDSDAEIENIDAEEQSHSEIEESNLDEPLPESIDEMPIEQEDDTYDDPTPWKQEFSDLQGGAEMLEMQPGTAPTSGGGKLGGLRSRMQTTNIGLSAANRGVPKPSVGPMEAKPNENIDPNQLHKVETNDRNIALWVQDGVESPLPKEVAPPADTQSAGRGEAPPKQAPPMDKKVIDETNPTEVLAALSNMRRVAPPVEPTVTLDINALMNLNAGELVILEHALEREISPSDEVLQQELVVGRPRLSQIFNGLLKFGILTVRKQGRSRLFRISAPAKDHLANLAPGGE
ncbi:MAG: hypothetical protein QF544_03330 [Candidatus Thalassarchaeaceae archaeon]|nr:hypothetical protein [Candidatus Thalassarchaeaceae archaeon]